MELALATLSWDREIVSLWLFSKGERTRQEYLAIISDFYRFVGKDLRSITAYDIQHYLQSRDDLAPSTQRLRLAVIKSLFSYSHRQGYLPFNTGAAFSLGKIADKLSERILTEVEVLRMISMEPNPRNRALITFLYLTGARAVEVEHLRWRDVHQGSHGVVITFLGKGKKVRNVHLEDKQWSSLDLVPGDPEEPVFLSQKGNPLDQTQIFRIVQRAGRRVGLMSVSPHWLRHAHASHALEHGAPISLVQATLGHATITTTGRYLHARPTESSSKYLHI